MNNRSVRITRSVQFCAAHRYHNPDLSDLENQQIFGACNRPHGHGHNYRLDVSITGEVDIQTGMVMNLADLDALLKREVVELLDHCFMNYDIEYFSKVIPTCENIVLWLFENLSPQLKELDQNLSSLRLWESDTLYAEAVA